MLATAATVAAATVGATLVAVGSSSAQDTDRGERIMNAGCQGCHETRLIEVQAKDRGAWLTTITSMVEKGAKVPMEDVAPLADYLTLRHGPLPDGPGKQVLLNTCTMCHDLSRIKRGRRTPEEWEETLLAMLNEGAMLSDAQFAQVHDYLSKNFNVE